MHNSPKIPSTAWIPHLPTAALEDGPGWCRATTQGPWKAAGMRWGTRKPQPFAPTQKLTELGETGLLGCHRLVLHQKPICSPAWTETKHVVKLSLTFQTLCLSLLSVGTARVHPTSMLTTLNYLGPNSTPRKQTEKTLEKRTYLLSQMQVQVAVLHTFTWIIIHFYSGSQTWHLN